MRFSTNHWGSRPFNAARWIFLGIVAISLLAAATSSVLAAKWNGKEEVREGVKHVLNPAEPVQKSKTSNLEEMWRIGGDTDDEDEFFGVISQILTDSEGNVYLLDTQLAQVNIFSKDGEFIRSIGREGEGPGEFRIPISMFFTDDGNLGVMQATPGKIVLLTKEGEPAGEHPLPQAQEGGFVSLFGGRSDGGNLVVAVAVNAFAEGKFAQTRYLTSINKEGAETARYCSDTRTIEMAKPIMNDMEWDTFDRRWTVGRDGRVYAAVTYPDYKIHVWEPNGDVAYVLEREYEHRKRTADEMKVMENLMGLFAKRIPNCAVTITDYTKDVEAFYVRDDGSVWVLNSNGMRDNPDATVGTFDVFDNKGRFVDQVTLAGEGNPQLDGYYFVGDRLYVVTDLVQAAISLQSGGESFQLGDEEPEPMAVIAYKLDNKFATSKR